MTPIASNATADPGSASPPSTMGDPWRQPGIPRRIDETPCGPPSVKGHIQHPIAALHKGDATAPQRQHRRRDVFQRRRHLTPTGEMQGQRSRSSPVPARAIAGGPNSPWCKCVVAPRPVMRPAGKARDARIWPICERRATQPGGMQRRSNADGLAPRAAKCPASEYVGLIRNRGSKIRYHVTVWRSLSVSRSAPITAVST
jgi:hypothetical protein